MARSVGYGGGRDYGYPDGGGAYGGGGGPKFYMPERESFDKTIESLSELGRELRKRRDEDAKKALAAEEEFRRITRAVPSGFVRNAVQEVGAETPEKKVAAAWHADRLWREEQSRQKESLARSKAIEKSTKEIEKSADAVRKEGQKRRNDLAKLEADRLKALTDFDTKNKAYRVRSGKARERDVMAAARLGLSASEAESSFDEPAPEMPSRAVHVYDENWNIVGTKVLPVSDPRNFIKEGTDGTLASLSGGGGQPGVSVPSADPTEVRMPPPSSRTGATPSPAGAEAAVSGETRTGSTLADQVRAKALRKKWEDEQKARAAEDKAWNAAVSKTRAAIRKNAGQRSVAELEKKASSLYFPSDEDVIAESWDWSVGEPPPVAQILSGEAIRRRENAEQKRTPSDPEFRFYSSGGVATEEPYPWERGRRSAAAPEGAYPEPAAAAQPAQARAESPEDKAFAQTYAGILAHKERIQKTQGPAAAGLYEEQALRMLDSQSGLPVDWVNARSEARRIARQQGEKAGQAFLTKAAERLTPEDQSALAQAGAWALRIGLPVAAGLGVGVVSGGTLALPAGGAAGLLGEDLARRIEGREPMNPEEVALYGATGMIPGFGGGQMAKAGLKQVMKRGLIEGGVTGAATGAVHAAVEPAIASKDPRLPSLGEVAGGAIAGGALGGILGAGIGGLAARYLGRRATPDVVAKVEADPQVTRLAERLAGASPEEQATILALLRARMHQLAAGRGGEGVNFESFPAPPRPGEPDFIGPVGGAMEGRLGATKGAGSLQQLAAEAEAAVAASRAFSDPNQYPSPIGPGMGEEALLRLSPVQQQVVRRIGWKTPEELAQLIQRVSTQYPQPIGPQLPRVGGAAAQAEGTLPAFDASGFDIDAIRAAARAAELDQLTARQPWAREGRGEGGETPIIEGAPAETVTPAGLALPQGAQPPAANRVAAVAQERQPGTEGHFMEWLQRRFRQPSPDGGDRPQFSAQEWRRQVESNDPLVQQRVQSIIDEYNASLKPEPPSFREWIGKRGLSPRDWDQMLQSNNPETQAQVDLLIRQYNEEAGFRGEGGPDLPETAPVGPEPAPQTREALDLAEQTKLRIAEAESRGGQMRGPEGPESFVMTRSEPPEDLTPQIERLRAEQDAIRRRVEGAPNLDPNIRARLAARYQQIEDEIASLFIAENYAAAAGTPETPGRAAQRAAAQADVAKIEGTAARNRAAAPAPEPVPSVPVAAEVSRATAALRKAEDALAAGGTVDVRRWENTARRRAAEPSAAGAGKRQAHDRGAQPWVEGRWTDTGEAKVPADPKTVTRSAFDAALDEAEQAVQAVRAVKAALKNNPEAHNAVNKSLIELEDRLRQLKQRQRTGRPDDRPVAAVRDTTEALSQARAELAKNPNNRDVRTRVRMLEERLSQLVRYAGGQRRYRSVRGSDGKYYVLRNATPEASATVSRWQNRTEAQLPAGWPGEGVRLPGQKERAVAGPFRDAEQAGQFADELDARMSDVELWRNEDADWLATLTQGGSEEPTLPVGKRGRGREVTETPVRQLPDERAVQRAEDLMIRRLQEEWATSGRPSVKPGLPPGAAGEVPPRGLGRSASVREGQIPVRARETYTQTGETSTRLEKIQQAQDALVKQILGNQLSAAERAALMAGDRVYPAGEPPPPTRGGAPSAPEAPPAAPAPPPRPAEPPVRVVDRRGLQGRVPEPEPKKGAKAANAAKAIEDAAAAVTGRKAPPAKAAPAKGKPPAKAAPAKAAESGPSKPSTRLSEPRVAKGLRKIAEAFKFKKDGYNNPTHNVDDLVKLGIAKNRAQAIGILNDIRAGRHPDYVLLSVPPALSEQRRAVTLGTGDDSARVYRFALGKRGDFPAQAAHRPFESAPAATRGGGTTADIFGLATASRALGRVTRAISGNRYMKALLGGPRHTLRVLQEDFGAAGRKIAEDFLQYQDRVHELGGKWKGELDEGLRLVRRDQMDDLVALLEDASLGPAADPEVALAASVIRDSLDEVALLASSNNRFARYLTDYFPHYALQDMDFAEQAQRLAEKLWRTSQFHRERMQALGATTSASPEAINYAGTTMIVPHMAGMDAKNAHLERARSGIGRQYRRDPGVLYAYFEAAAKSVAQAETWDRGITTATLGHTTQRLGDLKDQLAQLRITRPTEKQRVLDLQRALERELGFREAGDEPGLTQRIAGDVRDLVASKMLFLSWITQMGSLADTANTFGWKGFGRAVKAMTETAAERNAIRAGSVSSRGERAAKETAMALHGAGGSTGRSPITGLVRGHKWIGPDAVWMDAMVTVDRKQRIGADAAARHALPQFLQELSAMAPHTINFLKKANFSDKLILELQGLNPAVVRRHLEGQSVPADALRAIDAYARRMTEFSQQKPSPANLPPFWSTEFGRWMTMFMPFNLRQYQNMTQSILRNPARFIASGVPAYMIMGGIVTTMKAAASGYGFLGSSNDNAEIAEKLQQVLSNRPILPDSPEDVAFRAAQVFLATAPRPFAITAAEKAVRGFESTGEAALQVLGPGIGTAMTGPIVAARGVAGQGRPEDQSPSEYAGRSAIAAAGHLVLPSTFSYQLQRELVPSEESRSTKFRPTHQPGWVGRLRDLLPPSSEVQTHGLGGALGRALAGGIVGGDEYLSAERTKRRENIEEWRTRRKRERENDSRKKEIERRLRERKLRSLSFAGPVPYRGEGA